MEKYLVAENYSSNADYEGCGGDITILPIDDGVAKHLSALYVQMVMAYGRIDKVDRPHEVAYFYGAHTLAEGCCGTSCEAWDYITSKIEGGLHKVIHISDENFASDKIPFVRTEILEVRIQWEGAVILSAYLKHANVQYETGNIPINFIREHAGLPPLPSENELCTMSVASRVLGAHQSVFKIPE